MMDLPTAERQARAPGPLSAEHGGQGISPEAPDCAQRFQLLAELTGLAVYDHDFASRHAQWKGAVDVVTGWAPEELAGVQNTHWHELTHADDRDAVLAVVSRAQADRAGFRIEYRLRRKDGTYVRVEDRGAFLSDEPGGAPHALGSLSDISHRWELEQQLIQAQKMEAVGQLAGGVAHDFNNIIAIILCYAEQALRDSSPTAPQARALTQILKNGNRAVALTRQLLTFSRKGAACPAVLDLSGLVSQALGMLRRLIGEDVALVTELAPQLNGAFVDPGHVEQVIMNLAANARDAMPGGGTLTIRTKNVAASTLEGQMGSDRPRVLLEVQDTGQGIPPEVVPHIFEPFFTTKPEGHGTGLGLATVAGIVQQSNGEIYVDSTVGVGTTFSLYFPVAEREREACRAAAEAARSGGSETILLVEDDVPLLQILQAGLTRAGYKVLAASDGKQALALSRAHPGAIDMVLTDVIMPEMSGYELVSQLVTERPALRVLYLSGYTADFIARKGLSISGTELLSKPFTDDTLQARIRALLDREEP